MEMNLSAETIQRQRSVHKYAENQLTGNTIDANDSSNRLVTMLFFVFFC